MSGLAGAVQFAPPVHLDHAILTPAHFYPDCGSVARPASEFVPLTASFTIVGARAPSGRVRATMALISTAALRASTTGGVWW